MPFLLVDLYEQYNRVIDWSALARNVDGAYIKFSDGYGGPNVAADNYVNRCRSNGIPWGGYHYAESGTPDVQAGVFLAQCRRLGLVLAPALDLESGDIPMGARTPFAQRFLEALHQTYPVAVLYASASWLASLRPDNWPYAWDRTWCAAYGPNDGARHAISGYGGRVDLHQYTSVGRMSGVSGDVDLNYTDDLGALRLDSPAVSATSVEDDDMLVPAGENEHVSLIVKGKSKVYLGCAFGKSVTVHQIVWCGDTPADSDDPAYLPGGVDTDWTFAAGRPGPLTPPANAAQMIVRYTADHPYTLAAV